jgi:CelD/BcsL family acetyltransferase involved in cellulose biosynthesis
MTSAIVPVNFIVGSRKLWSVRRRLETVSFTLDNLIRGDAPSWPTPHTDVDGLRVLSAPPASLSAIHTGYPGYLIGGMQVYDRYYIEMEGVTYDEYFQKFSSKTRSTLKRKRRKLATVTDNRCEVREFKREEDIDAFMADAAPLSRRTYQSRLLDVGLPEGPEAVKEAKALARQGQVRAYILYADGKAVSYLYLPISNGIITYAHLGYEPSMASLSVGTILQLEALERLFAERCYRFFDFTEGTGAHKQMFGTSSVRACTFFALRPTLANRILMTSLRTFDSSVAMAKRVAARTGVMASIRKALRAGQ